MITGVLQFDQSMWHKITYKIDYLHQNDDQNRFEPFLPNTVQLLSIYFSILDF